MTDLHHKLRRIEEALHDEWFALSAVQYNEADHEVRIPFTERGLTLVVRGARRMFIDDREKVDLYDLNRLEFNPTRAELTIHTGVPLGFTIAVDDLKVLIEEEELR